MPQQQIRRDVERRLEERQCCGLKQCERLYSSTNLSIFAEIFTNIYKEDKGQTYELLCVVTISVNKATIIHIDSYSNIIKGVICSKSFEQTPVSFNRQNIKQIRIIAIYPKQYVTAQQVIQQMERGVVSKTQVYCNKFIEKRVEYPVNIDDSAGPFGKASQKQKQYKNNSKLINVKTSRSQEVKPQLKPSQLEKKGQKTSQKQEIHTALESIRNKLIQNNKAQTNHTNILSDQDCEEDTQPEQKNKKKQQYVESQESRKMFQLMEKVKPKIEPGISQKQNIGFYHDSESQDSIFVKMDVVSKQNDQLQNQNKIISHNFHQKPNQKSAKTAHLSNRPIGNLNNWINNLSKAK